MITEVYTEHERIILKKNMVIGEGGESVIFNNGKRALKIYRDPDKMRAEKLKSFLKSFAKLPKNIFAPLALLRDKRGNVVGFEMRKLLRGCNPIGALGNKNFCDANSINTKTVAELFIGLQDSLQQIHKQGMIIGDFNDRNEIMDPEFKKIAWIDVDSWQWGNYPCSVATEAYLSPDLYGLDLSKGPSFSAEHDWYSFAVLLFRSLLRLHPFRAGVHKQYKSLMARAEKGITVLDKDVRYPKIGLPPEVLSDELADMLLSFLKRKNKNAFPLKELKEYHALLIECPQCHFWYPAGRRLCPSCQAKSTFDLRLQSALAGADYEEWIKTSGRIIHTQVLGDRVLCLAEEDGDVILYERSNTLKPLKKKLFANRRGSRYKFFDKYLVVSLEDKTDAPELFVLDVSGATPKAVARTNTKILAGRQAVFSASSDCLYRIAGSKIMTCLPFANSGEMMEREVIQAMDAQTWFCAGTDTSRFHSLVGFYRIYGDLRWFLASSKDGIAFSRFELNLPELRKKEAGIDLAVKFSKTQALIIRKTRYKSREYVRLTEVSLKDGELIANYIFSVSDRKHYDSIHGKIYDNDLLIHASDQGIVFEKLSDGKENILKDSENLTHGRDTLLPYQDKILLITDSWIISLGSTRS